jgi:hypothetical protein
MARYRVMTWQGIPAQVQVSDDSGASVKKQMPAFFQQEIDRVAMRDGIIDSDEYLEAWVWSETAEREGSAEEVAEALLVELEQDWRRSNDRS